MGALMAVERVARHLIRMIAGRTQALTRRVHARSLKILIGLERLVTARHAVKGRPLLERERVDRHMMSAAANTPSSVLRQFAAVCPGRPHIRSHDTSRPASFTVAIAASARLAS